MSGYLSVDDSPARVSMESSTLRYPGPGSFPPRGILAQGVFHPEVSWPRDFSTPRYPGPGSHAQWDILAQGVFHLEVSWSRESCTVRYPGPGSHTQWGILAQGVFHPEVSWPRYTVGILTDVLYINCSVNVGCGPAEERVLLTGLHAVADIFCECCKTTLGWKYVSTWNFIMVELSRTVCNR